MTGFCDQCDKNDHESCMRIIGNLRLCRTCILHDPDYDCVFGCKCGEWQIKVVEKMLEKDNSNFIKCPACNEAIDIIYPIEDEKPYCCCPFGSLEEACKQYDCDNQCCRCCKNPFGQFMLDKIRTHAVEKAAFRCTCSTWDAQAMIDHMNGLGQRCLQCKRWISQACLDFFDDYQKSITCMCEQIDIEEMENAMQGKMKCNCPSCDKIFTRIMLEYEKHKKSKEPVHDQVNHPSHYQSDGMEVIDVIEAFKLGFPLGNAVKYILRAGKKDNGLQDLQKAAWYINHEIKKIIESYAFKRGK